MNTCYQLELTEIKRAWLDDAIARFKSLNLPSTWTADDLHKSLPRPDSDAWWGVLMAKLKNTGVVRCVGYTPSARPERNGGVVRVWEMVV
jgi:hypothetical protein